MGDFAVIAETRECTCGDDTGMGTMREQKEVFGLEFLDIDSERGDARRPYLYLVVSWFSFAVQRFSIPILHVPSLPPSLQSGHLN